MKQRLAVNLFKVLAGAIFFGCVTGCRVLDPAEDIPSYVHIDCITANGSTSKITDAWIFMDGTLIGGFELPCTVPVLAEGTHHFIIRAGVKQNGLSSTRAIFPFYKGWEGDVTLTRTQTTDLNCLSVDYFPAITTVWSEDFNNSAGIGIITDASYNPPLFRRGTDPAQQMPGQGGYGYVVCGAASSDSAMWIGRSGAAFALDATGEVWLEVNYKCNESVSVGITGSANDFHEWVALLPSADWNKIYIRLTDVIANAPSTSPYKIYFATQTTASSGAYVYLDNIKLLK